MKHWLLGSVRATLMMSLLVTGSAWAQLTLESSQQGDPKHPRALILIHGVQLGEWPGGKPGGNATWTEFLSHWKGDNEDDKKSWPSEDKSWALRQYCSVYTFTYDASILGMKAAPDTAKDLLNSLGNDPLKGSTEHDAVKGTTEILPTEIILIGHSNGGLVAREFATLMLQEGGKPFEIDRMFKVNRIVFLASPLDGGLISSMKWLRFALDNVGGTVYRVAIRSLGRGYRWIPEKLSFNRDYWRRRYESVHTRVSNYVGYGTQLTNSSFVSEVGQSLGREVFGGIGVTLGGTIGECSAVQEAGSVRLDDGFVTKDSATGKLSGSYFWEPSAKTPPKWKKFEYAWDPNPLNTLHGRLPHGDDFFQWVTYAYYHPAITEEISEVLDSVVLTDYLKRREYIESSCVKYRKMVQNYPQDSTSSPQNSNVFSPNLGAARTYWDPRKGTLAAHTTPEDLKKYMWEQPYDGAWKQGTNALIEQEIDAKEKELKAKKMEQEAKAAAAAALLHKP